MGNDYLAQTVKPEEAELEYLAKAVFSENAMGGRNAWLADANVFINRLDEGGYGKDLQSVIKKSSSAVRTNSKQWQIANNQNDMNFVERLVFSKIKESLRPLLTEDRVDNTKGATFFENVDKFGNPNWIDEVEETVKIGRHTYFKPKTKFKPESALAKVTKPTFGEAFAAARKAGKKTFMWNGEKKTTKLRGE